MKNREFRRLVLRAFGARSSTLDELLEYNKNVFDQSAAGRMVDDEPFISAWKAYVREAEVLGAYACLKDKLIQLRFPIRRGISTTAEYRDATRRGKLPAHDQRPSVIKEEGIEIQIRSTPGGRIPLIVAAERSDFELLVCALARRNEPVEIPASMGACLVAGLTNWDRVRHYRLQWESDHPGGDWAAEFPRFSNQKHLYQDCFIILSDGPYSGVAAADVGLSTETWRSISMTIRREHECTHYYTRRVLGSMRRNLLDEIIADYMGISEAVGRFRSDWFLRFMGLESYPAIRSGGRFKNYVGDLSDSAVDILARLVLLAAENLEESGPVAVGIPSNRLRKLQVLERLTSMTLEEMACDDLSGPGDKPALQEFRQHKDPNFISS